LGGTDRHHSNLHAAVELIHNSDSDIICRPINPLQTDME